MRTRGGGAVDRVRQSLGGSWGLTTAPRLRRRSQRDRSVELQPRLSPRCAECPSGQAAGRRRSGGSEPAHGGDQRRVPLVDGSAPGIHPARLQPLVSTTATAGAAAGASVMGFPAMEPRTRHASAVRRESTPEVPRLYAPAIAEVEDASTASRPDAAWVGGSSGGSGQSVEDGCPAGDGWRSPSSAAGWRPLSPEPRLE